MSRRMVGLIIRNDVLTDVRDLVTTTLGFDAVEHIGTGERVRRTGDVAGTSSHRVVHGRVPDHLWDDLLGILTTASQGIRDATDWQGKPGVAVEDARWAMATQAGDIVVGFRLTEDGANGYENFVTTLESLGFVFTSTDADDGI